MQSIDARFPDLPLHSPFLAELLARQSHPWPHDMAEAARAVLERLHRLNAAAPDAARQLRQLRQEFMLWLGLADLEGLELDDFFYLQTSFADRAITLATDLCLLQAAQSGKLRLPNPSQPRTGSGIAIVALGKLGGRELNYSSDVDLIVFFDPECPALTDADNATPVYVGITRALCAILSEADAGGRVFRTDLRLRPDPGSTPLAISWASAETYYSSRAQTWERAAFIRARPLAGDPPLLQAAQDLRARFVWQQHLDFAAIDDIRAIKRQIHHTHGHADATVLGHDLKVGHGGIREIEFFVQTLQLIYGGRLPALRPADTRAALRALAEAGLISSQAATELAAAYQWLRRMEHRLQMQADQQTHQLPATPAALEQFARFAGYDHVTAFRAELLHHLDRVRFHYSSLFIETRPLSRLGNLVFTGTDDDPETVRTLRQMGFAEPAAALALVRPWLAGRWPALRGGAQHRRLTQWLPDLMQQIGRSHQPDLVLLRLDGLFERLPEGSGWVAMCHDQPQLLRSLLRILADAPALSDLLTRQPRLLEGLLLQDQSASLPTPSVLAAALGHALDRAGTLEQAIDAARQFAEEHRFRAGLATLLQTHPAPAIGGWLADTAEAVLRGLWPYLLAEMARRHGPFPGRLAVLALGKLGERLPSIRSDLDLMLVYDAPADSLSTGAEPLPASSWATRLTARLVGALTTQTGTGALYPVDLRLRPSGNAGPLATSRDSFRHYYHHEAWVWEYMALTRARPVAGDAGLMAILASDIQQALARPRDPGRLRHDVLVMRQKIAASHPGHDPWDLKYRRGGLVDIDFIGQFLQLCHAHACPDILGHDLVASFTALARHGLLAADEAATLSRTLRLWHRLTAWLAVTSGRDFRLERLSPEHRRQLGRLLADAENGHAAIDFALIEPMLLAAQTRVREIFARRIG